MIPLSFALVVFAVAAWDGWRRWLALRARELVEGKRVAAIEERLAKVERTVEPIAIEREFRRK